MGREAVGQLVDRWLNEPAFRERLRADPEGTVRGAGAELDEEEWAALRGIDWSLPDEDLQSRDSKA